MGMCMLVICCTVSGHIAAENVRDIVEIGTYVLGHMNMLFSANARSFIKRLDFCFCNVMAMAKSTALFKMYVQFITVHPVRTTRTLQI